MRLRVVHDMSTVLNILGALVLCLPLLILAIHEHHLRRKTASSPEENQ